MRTYVIPRRIEVDPAFVMPTRNHFLTWSKLVCPSCIFVFNLQTLILEIFWEIQSRSIFFLSQRPVLLKMVQIGSLFRPLPTKRSILKSRYMKRYCNFQNLAAKIAWLKFVHTNNLTKRLTLPNLDLVSLGGF